MFDSSLRRTKDRLIEPLAVRLEGVPPVLITILALLTGLAAALFSAFGSVFLSLGMWLLSRLFDGLDGLIARLHKKQSDFGGYLDILLDYVVYAAVPLGLVLGHPTSLNFLALALMLSSFYINAASWMYLAAILEKRAVRANGTQTTIVMPVGLIGGTETIIAYCLFLLFPAAIPPLFFVFTTLVAVTIIQRIIWARRNIRESAQV